MTNRNRTISLLITLVVLSLLDCAKSNDNSPTRSIEMPYTATPSPTTIPAGVTPTPLIPFRFESSCWPSKLLQKGENIKGSLIVDADNNEAFYWDISSFHTKSRKPISGLWSPWAVLVSPDGNFLVDFPVDENKLTLTSSNQVLAVSIPPGKYYSAQYLVNGQVLIQGLANRNENYKEGVGFTDEYYIFDPTTAKLTAHSIFLPNFSKNIWDKFIITYSPDIHYVLYHSSLSDQMLGGFTLFDLAKQEIKWTVPDPNKEGGGGDALQNMPVWKPDASSLTYIGLSDDEHKDQNFFTLSLDGTLTQFTQFERIFEHGYVIFSQPQWSSDMRYLAFKFDQYGNSGKPQLFIWDDKEKILLSPCLPVEPNISPFYGFEWSFDNKHIQVSLSYPQYTSTSSEGPDHWEYRPVLLDIPNKTILKLPDENGMGNILGWVNWEIP